MRGPSGRREQPDGGTLSGARLSLSRHPPAMLRSGYDARADCASEVRAGVPSIRLSQRAETQGPRVSGTRCRRNASHAVTGS